MQYVHGNFATAKVFTNTADQNVLDQIETLLDQPFASGAKVRIMPDTHKGAGCPIGFTADLGDKVVPNLVGVDIGCGMLTVELGKQHHLDLSTLDDIIHNYVPAGFNVHDTVVAEFARLEDLICLPHLRGVEKFNRSIGTLGGGNHFIEVDADDQGNKYLVIHSGSRNLGKQVAEYYQAMAVDSCKGLDSLFEMEQSAIADLKATENARLISDELKRIKKLYAETQPVYPKDLCFLQGQQRLDYLHDMKLCQEYAVKSRFTMFDIIVDKLYGAVGFDFPFFSTIHNYINFEDNIIRKGAVSAREGERLIIPINMRDGSIIAVGKGNADWNFSAPHGAGRLMGRMEAKRTLSPSLFEEQMVGIYTTTANESTLDEAPDAYKSMNEILDNIGDTVDVEKIIRPIYNFKSSGE